MDSCQTSAVKRSSSPACKRHALSGLSRHARDAKAAFKRQDTNARKPSNITLDSTVLPEIEKGQKNICDECGTIVYMDTESKKSLDHVFYGDSQAETSNIIMES